MKLEMINWRHAMLVDLSDDFETSDEIYAADLYSGSVIYAADLYFGSAITDILYWTLYDYLRAAVR